MVRPRDDQAARLTGEWRKHAAARGDSAAPPRMQQSAQAVYFA
jgi:hypothetical protein